MSNELHEIAGGGFYLDLQGMDAELAALRDELDTYPYEGNLGVQGAGGQSSIKRTTVEENLIGEALELMLGALPEIPWALEWWMNRTPETAAIAAHAHSGEWAGLLYVGLPPDPAALEFVGLSTKREPSGFDPGAGPWPEPAAAVEARIGRLIVWPAHRFHQVAAREEPSGRPVGHRLALVFNAARA